jgi:hypothetical protein
VRGKPALYPAFFVFDVTPTPLFFRDGLATAL